jgi:hypothetical protein
VLARVVKLGLRRWRAIKATLLDGNYIEVRDGFLWQAKCEERLEKDGKFSRSQKDKAKKNWASKQAKLLNGRHSVSAPASPAADASTATASLSVAKATGGNPPPDDPVKALWDFGISVLTAAGETEKRARDMIGKWRKDLRDDGRLLALLMAAKKNHAMAPVAYVQKAIGSWTSPTGGMN